MILERGNMWDVFGQGIFMITTNPIQRKDGAVVMGRGIALEAKTKFPELPYIFGEKLKKNGNLFVDQIGVFDSVPIWYFMVKDHWFKDADLGIIASSCWMLQKHFLGMDQRVDLNFPGIGNGKLPRDRVLYLLEELPDNIHIWEYA